MREVTTADGEFILMLMNEPAYIQHIGDRGIRTVENARSYILDKFTVSYAKFGYGMYLVELAGKRLSVGICGFVRREAFAHPDIGFAFLREYWSRGLAYEAARALLAYGRGTLGFKVVLGVTSPRNQPSIRLLEKLGLRYQKMVRVPPVDRDSMLFSTEGEAAAARRAPMP